MTKNLNDYKFIVNTGCSYGVMTDSIFGYAMNYCDKKLNLNLIESDEDIVYIDVSMSSQGVDWQSESIIYTCNELLKLGIKPENIFVFIEWSQWSRITVHPFQYFNLDLNKLNFTHDQRFIPKLFSNNKTNYFDKIKLDISSTHNFGNIGKIKDTLFVNVNSMENDTFKNSGLDYQFFFEKTKKIQFETPQEIHLRGYLNTILKTQNYLKYNSINYNCVHMQCDLSGWFLDKSGVVKHNLTHELYDFSPYRLNKNKIEKNLNYNLLDLKLSKLEDAYPELKIYINQLDFSNFWFYENEKYSRGGYDEWCIDTFHEVGYVSMHEPDFNANNIFCCYGQHPIPIFYSLLWNDISKNCNFLKLNKQWNSILMEHFYEDYNSDKTTEHGLTISKQMWYKSKG